MQAGQLRERITFAQRQPGSDDYGNNEDAYADQFTVAAQYQFLRGGEDVMAARLDTRQPVVVTVRASDDTRRIKGDWRGRDARDSTKIFAIKSISPGSRRDFIDILCELGVATNG